MEDTKLYDSQIIERLKQKIAIYRETLTTLKRGTSIEDFLKKKEEFDGFKIQIAHLEGLSKTLNENQGMQIDGYEEKVKQIVNQLDILNKTVEEMNHEISSLLKKELKVEANEKIEINITPDKVDTSLNVVNQVSEIPEKIPQVKEPLLLTNNQPSYMQLQKFAGLALSKMEDSIEEKPDESIPTSQKPPERRHFNQQYFQSISTHPNHIYNGLYKNVTNTSSFHFKNESSVQKIPIYTNNPNENTQPDLTDAIENTAAPVIETVESVDMATVEKVNEVEVTVETAEKIDYSPAPIVDEIESINTAVTKIENKNLPIIDEIESINTTEEEMEEVALEPPIEVINTQEEPLSEAVPEERKKEGFSSFLNLFRKRN